MVTSHTRKSWLVLGICVLFMALFSTIPVLRDRAVSILDRSHHSNVERVHMWRAGLAMWKSKPLLGMGPGSVKLLSVDYQTPDEKVWGAWGHLHSIYINFLAERGALGFLTFVLFMASLLVGTSGGPEEIHWRSLAGGGLPRDLARFSRVSHRRFDRDRLQYRRRHDDLLFHPRSGPLSIAP